MLFGFGLGVIAVMQLMVIIAVIGVKETDPWLACRWHGLGIDFDGIRRHG